MDGKNNFNKNQDIHQVITSYNRFVPYQLLKILGKENITDIRLGDQVEKNTSILFTDIRDFTSLSEVLSPQENFNFINSFLSQMEPLISAKNGIIDKFIGDAIMAIFIDSANDALDCAILMLNQLKSYNEGRTRAGYEPISIGIGINTGLSMIGTVGGFNRMEGTVISDAVNLASRVEDSTKKYSTGLLICENTYQSLEYVERYDVRFIDRIKVKGKIRPQSIYEVYNNDNPEIKKLKNESKATFEEALACYHYKKIDKAQSLLEDCLKDNPEDKPAAVYLERCKKFKDLNIHEGTSELGDNVAWSSEFEIGHEVLDKQHFELYNKSIELIEHLDKEDAADEVEKILDYLENYVVEHFDAEEKIMEEIDYPFIDLQRTQHRNFIDSFISLKKELEELKSSKTYLMFRTQILLVDWLINHTMKADKHLGRFINH